VQRVALEAAQIFGGMGVMRELPMQKYVRDALIFLHSEEHQRRRAPAHRRRPRGLSRPGLMANGG